MTPSTVTLKVFGGYTFNSYSSIELKDGYYSISGPYKEITSTEPSKLVDIIENDTNCKEETCLYTGDTLRNYLQYPIDTDKTKNIWRILGSYKDGNNVVAKLISESKSTTSVSEIQTSLTSFYNTLTQTDKNIYKTNKFNCSGSGCSTSTYENIGLITTYEYNKIGGVN